MDIKRAIIASIILWIIDIIITMILFFVFFASNSTIIGYIVIAIPTIIATFIACKYYFRAKKIKNNGEYLKVALIFLISGIIAYLFYRTLAGFDIEISAIKIVASPLTVLVLKLFKLI